MAYHDDKPGHTPIIEGREYYQWRSYPTICKLIVYNQATGICKLRYPGGVFYISATELSNWYIVPEE